MRIADPKRSSSSTPFDVTTAFSDKRCSNDKDFPTLPSADGGKVTLSVVSFDKFVASHSVSEPILHDAVSNVVVTRRTTVAFGSNRNLVILGKTSASLEAVCLMSAGVGSIQGMIPGDVPERSRKDVD